MKKVGIIRCQQTEDMCPGTADFKVAKAGKLAFETIGPCEIVGFVSCGGCPGKKAVPRAKMMIDRGAEVIAMASCIAKGNPIGYACPHFENMRNAIKKVTKDIELLEWTH
ncbi:CGGC domain-containing protein [Prolixibacteraceae bacterium JC049]|nr:CGGC domain-containing protein [Prolixibacteraceae bacterium JC049]